MMRFKIIVCIMTALMVSSHTVAQTFDEFRRQREKEVDSLQRSQLRSMQQMQASFDNYVTQKDAEFAAFLAERWEAYRVFEAAQRTPRPKPDAVPVFEDTRSKDSIQRITTITAPSVRVDPGVNVMIPRMYRSAAPEVSGNKQSFIFYGADVVVYYDTALLVDRLSAVSQEVVSAYWEKTCRSDYVGLVYQLLELKFQLNLNDYGYYMLLKKFASKVYPDDVMREDLMVWMLLVRSGYKARIAYADGQSCVLLPARTMVYGMAYLLEDEVKYYLTREIPSPIYTYGKDHPDAGYLLDFSFNAPLNLPYNEYVRELPFNINGNPITFSFSVNRNLIDFYEYYPQVDLNIYFSAPVAYETKVSIELAFKSLLERLSEDEQANFLLRFTQSAFKYMTDHAQFGREKYFFPEEILYYPYSDCEDRSVWYAYIVQHLMKRRVVGIEYPNHVSTAVNLDVFVPGVYVEHQGERFMMADPTFINAPVGKVMPDYVDVAARVIDPDNGWLDQAMQDRIWAVIQRGGGHKGSYQKDIVLQKDKGACLTGYFVEQMHAGNGPLFKTGQPETRSFFVLRCSQEGDVIWAKSVKGKGHSQGFSIAVDGQGNFFVAGSFTGELDFGEGMEKLLCKEGMQDVFVARYSPSGKLQWVEKLGLDQQPDMDQLVYHAVITPEGNMQRLNLYNESTSYLDQGLDVIPETAVHLSGRIPSSNARWASVSSMPALTQGYSMVESLKAENDRLIDLSYEPGIAGLFAFIHHIREKQSVIEGNQVVKALDIYNPGFRSRCPNIYRNLTKIRLVINNEGIIKIETIDDSFVSFDKLKVNHGASVRLQTLQNGDMQLNVLSGIQVGKMVVWYNLNFIRLFKKDGNLLFDFNNDHTRKTYNLRRDILL